MAANAEMRASILSQILQPAAKDRLSRLSLVRPDKVRSVEDSLLMAAKSGKVRFINIFFKLDCAWFHIEKRLLFDLLSFAL